MKTMRLPALLALAVLAGCTTITPEQQREADEETCRAYGFTRKNDAFAECLQRIELDRRAAQRAVFQYDPWLFAPPPRVIVIDRPRRY